MKDVDGVKALTAVAAAATIAAKTFVDTLMILFCWFVVAVGFFCDATGRAIG